MNKEIFYNYCPIIQFVDYYSNKWKATAKKNSRGDESGTVKQLSLCDNCLFMPPLSGNKSSFAVMIMRHKEPI